MSNQSKLEAQVYTGLTSAGVSSANAERLGRRLLNDAALSKAFFDADIFAMFNRTATGPENLARAYAFTLHLQSPQTKEQIKTKFDDYKAGRVSNAPGIIATTANALLATPEAPQGPLTLAVAAPGATASTPSAVAAVPLSPRAEAFFRPITGDYLLETRAKLRNINETLPYTKGATVAPLTTTVNTQAFGNARSALDTMLVDIRGRHTRELLNHAENLRTMGEALDEAYEEFAKVIETSGKAMNAKIAMAGSLFAILAESGLFPLNIVGKIGGGACKLLHADIEIPQTNFQRERGLERTKSTIGDLIGRAEDLGARFNDFTRVGLDTSSLQGKSSLKRALQACGHQAADLSTQALNQMIVERFGDTDQARQNFIRRRIAAHQESGGMMGSHLTNSLVDHIKEVSRDTCAGLHQYFARKRYRTEDLANWVELDLWARYFAELFKGDKYDATIPPAVIDRLAQLQVVSKKQSGEHYRTVVSRKRLPWGDDHPVHKLGIKLFFQWYLAAKPFRIITGNLSAERLQEAKDQYIQAIGNAIDQNKSRGFFSRHTNVAADKMANVTKVQQTQIGNLR
jgi:hypothetical protein